MKAYFILLFFSAFLVNALFGAIVTSPISSESEFFSVPVDDRSFHVLMREDGQQDDTRELFIGDGDFAVPATDPNQEADFEWTLGVAEPFSLVHDSAGNLDFYMGSDFIFSDQPTASIKQLYIGNRTKSNLNLFGVALTNLSLNSEPLGDLITTGGDNHFAGLVVSGIDFNSNWTLSGTITYTGLTLEGVGSGVLIYGSSVPEPSYYAFLFGLIMLLIIGRHKRIYQR